MNILATVSAIRYYPYYWYPALSPALMHGLSAGSSDHAGSQRKKNNCRYNNFLNSFILKFLCTITIVCQCAYTQILITELYRDPPGSESSLCGGASHEFIEILNIGTDTFKINNLFITDGMESDSVIPLREKLSMHPKCIYNRRFICPGQFALILDPDYSEALIEMVAHSYKDIQCYWVIRRLKWLVFRDGVVLIRSKRRRLNRKLLIIQIRFNLLLQENNFGFGIK